MVRTIAGAYCFPSLLIISYKSGDEGGQRTIKYGRRAEFLPENTDFNFWLFGAIIWSGLNFCFGVYVSFNSEM